MLLLIINIIANMYSVFELESTLLLVLEVPGPRFDWGNCYFE